MRVQSMSIVVGTRACDAACPFCVSYMTGFEQLPKGDPDDINWRNFHTALRYAKLGGVTTVLLTGKGEPTLYPRQITAYLRELKDQFPTIEMQTNAIRWGREWSGGGLARETNTYVSMWHDMGLDTVAISTVGIPAEWNKEVYLHHRKSAYPDLAITVGKLRKAGLSVRLCVMMAKGYVDNAEAVLDTVRWAREHDVGQLTFRPIRKPAQAVETAPGEYVNARGLTADEALAALHPIIAKGTPVLDLMHGARIFDVAGQNVCVSDCLTHSTSPDEMRQLIFFGDGRIAYSWEHKGATLLQGRG